jgi:hypothetical protein
MSRTEIACSAGGTLDIWVCPANKIITIANYARRTEARDDNERSLFAFSRRKFEILRAPTFTCWHMYQETYLLP